ncbi:MAG: ATP-grasp domain-containing protein [Lachnospiraceae bacterium]|nr:ATP-grasp domain-containing protein [Lachnospiraceae bacterium]
MCSLRDRETVIVLSGTKWQIPLVKKLKEKGCRVVVFNLLPDSPAFPYADDYRIVDILNHEACLKAAAEYFPSAFMSDECDIAVPSVAYLSEKMGFISIGREMGELYTNKYKMRVFGKEHAFDTPTFYKCGEMDEAIRLFRAFGGKMIMKPMDANSSRGVYSIACEKDIVEHFADTIRFSKIEKCVLLEEYIEGTEFTVDGIKTEKGHISLAISEKRHYAYNENIACSLYFSYQNDRFDYDRLRSINDRFVELSGLPFGLTHAEYKYKDGRFYLIEIGARGGGNLISASIVPLITGVDTYDYLIDKTLGRICKEEIFVSEEYRERCAILQFFDVGSAEGIVKEIRGEEYLSKNKNIVEYAIYCKVGDKIVNAADDSKRIGFYIAYGENRQELETVIRETESVFQIITAGL